MKSIRIFGLLAISSLLILGACSKTTTDPQPATGMSVVPAANFTTYSGQYSYTDATGKVVAQDNVKATVTDLNNNKLQVVFSAAGSPSLTFTMKKQNNTYVNLDFSTQTGITFDNSGLDIGMSSTNPVYQLAYSGTR